ncbi:MAG: hypothetical protein PHW73_04095 [Atribacterota bacterium]|nr:hypothetical protein [Atribacterota bacterium]
MINFSLLDARIYVDNEKNRLVVIPIAKCGEISLVWVIDNLSPKNNSGEIIGMSVMRNVISCYLEPLTEEDYEKPQA